MQKVVTIAVDTTQLYQAKAGPFSVNELDEINEFLELGWQIEEWDFLKEGESDGQVILIAILNDDTMFENEEDDFDMEFDQDEEYQQEIKESKD
jgi:hypothetical protein